MASYVEEPGVINRKIAPEPQVILIHGVGLPGPELFGSQRAELCKYFGFDTDSITTIDWHGVVAHPVDLDDDCRGATSSIRYSIRRAFRKAMTLNFPDFSSQQFAQLMRGMLGAASSCEPRLVPRLTAGLLCCAPLMLIWLLYVVTTFVWAPAEFPVLLNPMRLAISVFDPRDVLQALHVVPIAFWLLVIFLSLSSVFRGVIRRDWNGACLSIRRASIGMLRPVVFLLGLVSQLWSFYILPYGLCILLSTTGNWTNERSVSSTGIPIIGSSGGLQLITLGAFVALVCILFGIAVFVFLLTVIGPLAWSRKVIADVVCFMGDREYARSLLRHVHGELSGIAFEENQEVVLVGHSLGSVIGLLSVLDGDSPLPRSTKLRVLTMGSPIALLARFFPESIPSGDELRQQLVNRYANATWLNVYRPWDPIGGKIFNRRNRCAMDGSTRQYKNVLFGHTNYWDDEEVWRIARDQFPKLNPVQQCNVDLQIGEGARPRSVDEYPMYVQRSSRIGVICAVLLAASLFAGFNFFWASPTNRNDERALLGARGEQVEGYLYAYRELVRHGSVTRYVVAFAPPKSKTLAFGVGSYDVLGGPRERLAESPEDVVLQEFGPFGGKEGERVPVVVRFLPDDPGVFDFPEARVFHGGVTFYAGFMTFLAFGLSGVGLWFSFYWAGSIYSGVAPKLP